MTDAGDGGGVESVECGVVEGEVEEGGATGERRRNLSTPARCDCRTVWMDVTPDQMFRWSCAWVRRATERDVASESVWTRRAPGTVRDGVEEEEEGEDEEVCVLLSSGWPFDESVCVAGSMPSR